MTDTTTTSSDSDNSALLISAGPELGGNLLKIARSMRQTAMFPWKPQEQVFDAILFWQLIPELAYRMGWMDFEKGERSDEAVRSMTSARLAREFDRIVPGVGMHRYPDCDRGSVLLDQKTTPDNLLRRWAAWLADANNHSPPLVEDQPDAAESEHIEQPSLF